MVTSASAGDSGDAIVDLPNYRVIIAPGVLARVREIVDGVAPAHRYAIITDDHVGPLYANRVRASLGEARTRVLSVAAGEAQKTRETWAALTDALLADGFGRDSTIIALGGGVVGDLAGFVAATYMRGVPVVQVPTSLLAMVDASVGGKTGVDTPTGKNLVGVFHQPTVVLADPEVLRTLPPAHLRAGLAEALKHGVIASEEYFEAVVAQAEEIVAARGSARTLTELVARSVAIKADVVRRDEREGGVRKTLNFGHTLGHGIESASDYSLLHGEAIAIGMVLESVLAERLGIAEPGTARRIRDAVVRAGLPDSMPVGLSQESVLHATRSDKKSRGGAVEYALPARIGAMAGGNTGWSVAVPSAIVHEVVGSADAGRRE